MADPAAYIRNFKNFTNGDLTVDIHVSESIMKEWHAQCGIDASGIFT